MDIQSLQAGYATGLRTPRDIVAGIFDRIEREGLAPIWITVVERALALRRADGLTTEGRRTQPLWGVPFAVKDNIDVAGMPTTAACPEFAYIASESATVVARLEAAGAVLIGKTNMDQFATGLVGTRTPYGVCSSVFDAGSISGGSSAGSAVAVAGGLVAFALGTDTAGSGRVPAMFNNLVGPKPTRGVLSTHGCVPACRSLDCVSIFAETAGDAATVLQAAQGFDERDPFSRSPAIGAGASPWAGAEAFRFGVPRAEDLEFFGDPHNRLMYERAVEAARTLGGEPVEFDLRPFLDAAQLLYKGPWVAERLAALRAFLATAPATLDATVEGIVRGAGSYSAVDAFVAQYALKQIERTTGPLWGRIDWMLLPTAPRTYTLAEIAEAPIERNSHLGYYTNFVNLLDLAAVAVPAGIRPDGLPFGVSLIGRAFTESALLQAGDRVHRALGITLGGSRRPLSEAAKLSPKLSPTSAPPGCLLMAVVGAHLTGQPLNWQLAERGARLQRTCRTSREYRLYALSNTRPAKPGLVRQPGFEGPGIEVEVWAMPADSVGSFVDGVPQPLAIGKLELEDGSLVMGFLAEPAAALDAQEITELGGWRAYLDRLQQPA